MKKKKKKKNPNEEYAKTLCFFWSSYIGMRYVRLFARKENHNRVV